MAKAEERLMKEALSVSDVLNKNVRKFGTSLISNLYMALKSTRLYSFDHPNVLDAAKQFAETVNFFIENESQCILATQEEYLFLNDVRLKVASGGFEVFQFVAREFQARGVGKATFHQSIGVPEVRKFVEAWNAANTKSETPLEDFRAKIAERGVETITLDAWQAQKVDVSEQNRSPSIESFFRNVNILNDVDTAIAENRKLNVRKAKRAIQGMVDQIQEDEHTVLAMVAVKNLADYLVNHSVNVSILAMVLGHRIGIPKKALGDLGLAALFHDLGMTKIPDGIRSKTRQLTDAEWASIKRHPLEGAKVLLGSDRIVDVVVRSMQAAFGHHMRHDRSGYPRLQGSEGKPVSIFTEIVSLCDVYDAMTSSRPYRKRPLAPHQALQMLLKEAGSFYDAVLVKSFVNTLGIFPVGSLVLLNTGEVGTVHRPNIDPALMHRPKIKIFSDPSGTAINRIVDLSEKNPRTGEFRREIARILDPKEVDLDVNEYLAVI